MDRPMEQGPAMSSRFRFVDSIEMRARGGRGGDGIVSFRREAFVPKGGPDGGDGGRGGSVVILADSGLATLADLAGRPVYAAGDGRNGGPAVRTGRNGEDLIVRVPPGTQIFDQATGEMLADLDDHEDSFPVAEGGAAGRGNASFATARRRAPRFRTRGEPGEERRVRLELKLLADIGLIGLPNAGKSTMIRAISASRSRVGDYPFTTLHPALGVVAVGRGRSFVVADLPGLIEGSADGAGLGHRFLKHAERNRALVVLVAPDLEIPPSAQYDLLLRELESYRISTGNDLTRLVRLVLLTKIDTVADRASVESLLFGLPKGSLSVSAMTGEGMENIESLLYGLLEEDADG